MIDVSFAAVDRLAACVGEQFAFIGSVADFAALGDLPRSLPAAYVIPLDERAEPSDMIGVNAQTHTAMFCVVLIVRHAGDASGAKAALALDALRKAVHDALIGWAPPECFDAVQFVFGSLAELIGGGTIAWRDDFSVRRRIIR